MKNPRLYILTRCTRPENLKYLLGSIDTSQLNYRINWVLIILIQCLEFIIHQVIIHNGINI